MSFAEKFKEFYRIPAYSSLNQIGGMGCYVKICDFAVASFERYENEYESWMNVYVYHGGILEHSGWIYKEWLYFLEQLKDINTDLAKKIPVDVLSRSFAFEKFKDGSTIWGNELGEYKI